MKKKVRVRRVNTVIQHSFLFVNKKMPFEIMVERKISELCAISVKCGFTMFAKTPLMKTLKQKVTFIKLALKFE